MTAFIKIYEAADLTYMNIIVTEQRSLNNNL